MNFDFICCVKVQLVILIYMYRGGKFLLEMMFRRWLWDFSVILNDSYFIFIKYMIIFTLNDEVKNDLPACLTSMQTKYSCSCKTGIYGAVENIRELAATFRIKYMENSLMLRTRVWKLDQSTLSVMSGWVRFVENALSAHSRNAQCKSQPIDITVICTVCAVL